MPVRAAAISRCGTSPSIALRVLRLLHPPPVFATWFALPRLHLVGSYLPFPPGVYLVLLCL